MKDKPRFRVYERRGCLAELPVHPREGTMDPDPDGSHARMLEAGWKCIRVDPIPGISLAWRPLGFYTGRW